MTPASAQRLTSARTWSALPMITVSVTISSGTDGGGLVLAAGTEERADLVDHLAVAHAR